MRIRLKKIALPVIVVGIIALQGLALPSSRYRFYCQNDDEIFDEEEDKEEDYEIIDSATLATWPVDSLIHFTDSMILLSQDDSIPDEWLYTVPLDSVIQMRVDSIYRDIFIKDSIEKARIAFQQWFDSLPRKQQKIWIKENIIFPEQMRKADSIMARQDSIKALKDSIVQATPRILETPFLPDSLYYKRILMMTQDKRFGDIRIEKLDTTYNYSFYDYPFFREDVNATWQGIAGSAVQNYNFHKRTEEEDAIFFTPYRVWSHTPSTIPLYNTKTPYTELGYFGTPFSGENKEEINLRLLTTQNILPSLNLTFEINKYGGGGNMKNSNTAGYDMALTTNYFGKKYLLHAGWLHDKITRVENGGFIDSKWIKDTTVAIREIDVNLAKAENIIKRNTIFLNHSYRISFGNDSLTTAFIGHNLDWSTYEKQYNDQISDAAGRKFYNNNFHISPNKSADTMKVMKLDNKLFIRLQPWKETSIVSKIDVGIGDKMLIYNDFYNDSTLVGTKKTMLNNLYAYAGAKGMIKQYFNWDANADLYFAGYQVGDFDIDANMYFNMFPFRKARKSPLTIAAHFHTDLSAPDHYEQRVLTNHYKWNNSFGKKSHTEIGGTMDIPYWKLNLDVRYSILTGSIYYDNTSQIGQFTKAVNVLSASLRKDFTLWKFHLDNRILFQYSSNPEIIPVPTLALNLRYYLQFNIVKDVLQMQIGANGLYNTKWNMPGFNPNLGVFFNQTKESYGACPYIDVFLNMQWKRACIFIKIENVNQGWPNKIKDYFTADGYVHTPLGLKFGLQWPFYVTPVKSSHSASSAGGKRGELHQMR